MTTQEFLDKLCILIDEYEGSNGNEVSCVKVWPIGTNFFDQDTKQTVYGWNGERMVEYLSEFAFSDEERL